MLTTADYDILGCPPVETSGTNHTMYDGSVKYASGSWMKLWVKVTTHAPTKLIRNLVSVFFTPSVMASSSCGGTRQFSALNKDIVAACIRK